MEDSAALTVMMMNKCSLGRSNRTRESDQSPYTAKLLQVVCKGLEVMG
jgi:hypothetical protein